MDTLLLYFTLFYFFCLLVSVFFHEFGRYIQARLSGVHVTSFTFGIGPKLFIHSERSGTQWVWRCLPLWAYLKLQNNKNENSFYIAAFWKRLLITLAGPLFLVFLAFCLMTASNKISGETIIAPVVGKVLQSTPAEQGGLKANDKILTINGNAINRFRDIQEFVGNKKNHPLEIKLLREGEELTLNVNPRREIHNNGHEYYILGIASLQNSDKGFINKDISIWEAAQRSLKLILQMYAAPVQSLFRERLGNSADKLAGPLKIANINGSIETKLGLVTFIQIAAVIFLSVSFHLLLIFPFLFLWQQYWRYRILRQDQSTSKS